MYEMISATVPKKVSLAVISAVAAVGGTPADASVLIGIMIGLMTGTIARIAYDAERSEKTKVPPRKKAYLFAYWGIIAAGMFWAEDHYDLSARAVPFFTGLLAFGGYELMMASLNRATKEIEQRDIDLAGLLGAKAPVKVEKTEEDGTEPPKP